MLLEHYNTPELATALVDLGSLSMVRERLAPDEGETHRFDKPVRHGPKGGITTAYHRDRGDDLEIDSVVVDTPVVLKNAETLFLNILKEENITYGYLYNVADKLWYATDTVQDNRFFVLDENFKAVADEVKRLKPATVKGRYITKVTITSTMNPGVPVDPVALA